MTHRSKLGQTYGQSINYEADVLVFDEATNAWDGITEKVIMEAILTLVDQ